MGKFQSTKIFDGFSTVFRQWKVTFEGDLDYRNWVWDFGGMKRSKTKIDGMSAKEWMDYTFDHTTVIANDDPELNIFTEMDRSGIIQLRILEATGAEKFSEYIFNKLNEFVIQETDSRVKIIRVEFSENKKNTAIYEAD